MQDFYSVDDVLSFAIRLEQASQAFYHQLSREVHNRPVSQFLASLVKEENLHEAQLRQLLDEQGVMLNKSISAAEVDRYIQAMDVSETLDYKDAVRLAMEKENAAAMLYSIMAGIMDDEDLKATFRLLAEQEKGHQSFFEKEYRRICVSEN